jgi:hypothetical protein
MSQRKSSASWVPGVILILLGTAFLFDRLFLLDVVRTMFRLFDDWWPMFWVALGAVWLLLWKPRRKAFPILLIAGGLIAQLSELRIFHWWTWHNMWPLLLITGGAWMLYSRVRAQNAPQPPDPGQTAVFGASAGKNTDEPAELVDAFVAFGGLERTATSKNFRGGEASAVFGGIELDLRRAQLAPGDQRMKLFALFGGIELMVPPEMAVVVQGTPILGAITNTRQASAAAAPREVTAADLAGPPAPAASRLIVDGFAILGGIEVKA